jgi:phage baseplate assembly protein V
MSAVDELGRYILALEKRMEQLDRRLNNTVREAKVVEIDADKGLVKVEAHGLKSGWSPWLTRAGDIVEWEPPTVGERVVFVSPTGEPGQGFVLQGGYSDQFKQPSTDKGERLIKIGDNIASMTKERTIIGFKDGGRVVVKKELAKLKTASGHVVVKGGDIIVSTDPVVGDDPDSD